MLNLPPSVRIFVATQPVDGRKGFDILAAMIRTVFVHDVFLGHLYVFFSKRCDRQSLLRRARLCCHLQRMLLHPPAPEALRR